MTNKEKKSMFNENSSPFDSSPFNSNSPRLYWQSRDPRSPVRFNAENRAPLGDPDTSPSPSKRPSVENLKRASRVKNSNMFAREHKQEYDPASSPLIERPLATGRPLSTQVQGSAYGSRVLKDFRKENVANDKKTPINSPLRSPLRWTAYFNRPALQARVRPPQPNLLFPKIADTPKHTRHSILRTVSGLTKRIPTPSISCLQESRCIAMRRVSHLMLRLRKSMNMR